MSATRPVSEIQRAVTPGEADENLARWGWSAVLNINTADRTASRRVGHELIPMRRLVAFETILVDRPSEKDNAQWGETEVVSHTAKACAYEIYQDYHQQGFARFYSLVGRSDAEEIFASVCPVDFPTLKQAKEFFESYEPEDRIEMLPEHQRQAAQQLVADIRGAIERAWVYANDTLDASETEMRERANGSSRGKKRYDPLDLHLYEQTERVKPEFQAAEATAQHGLAVGEAIGGQLAEVVGQLAEGQAAQAAALAQIAEQQRAQSEQNNLTQQALLAFIQSQTEKKGPKAGK